MSAAELIREEPPIRAKREIQISPSYGEFLTWLLSIKEHPGEWFKFPKPQSQPRASQILRGSTKAVAAGDFEYQYRPVGGGHDNPRMRTVYARYVGTETDGES